MVTMPKEQLTVIRRLPDSGAAKHDWQTGTIDVAFAKQGGVRS